MQFFQNLWSWLDGKKTVIALLVGFVAKTLTGLEADVLGGQSVPAIDAVINICNTIYTYLGILGLGHIAVKGGVGKTPVAITK